MNKVTKTLFILFIVLFLFFIYYFFINKDMERKKITWGVNFSQMQAEALKLDWKKTYLAILEDLEVKNIKLHTQWNFVEGNPPPPKASDGQRKHNYYFNDIDWQIQQSKKHQASLIYVVGMKTGRWPECHIPAWAKNLSKEEQQDEILQYIKEVVTRYKGSRSITAWQAENEPLFKFGVCPWYDKEFLKKEVSLIKSLDSTRPVIVSDSGEQSLWIEVAKIGDIVGTTMYRKVWVHITDKLGFYFNFPIPAISYRIKAETIKKLFGKEVINVELQAEPWVKDVYIETPLKEQEKSMNLTQFKKNVEYAKKTGFNKFYFWGAEWWFWLKEKQGNPEIWNEAKKLF